MKTPLDQKIEAYQEAHPVNFLERSEENIDIIIGVGDNELKPRGLIKSCALDLQTGAFTYGLTNEPQDAMRFNAKVSMMLHAIPALVGETLLQTHFFVAKLKEV